MKNWIVYHQVKPPTEESPGVDCPDGICAAWIVSRAVSHINPLDSWEVVGDSYQDAAAYTGMESLPFTLGFEDRLWLVDFSYPAHILQQLSAQNRVTILDHHITRMDDISQVSDRILGGYYPNECGATAAWKLCFPFHQMPWFLESVRDRDIGANGYYDGNAPESRAISTAISARRKGKVGVEAFPVLEQLLSANYYEVVDEGNELLKADDDRCAEIIQEWRQTPAFLEIDETSVPLLTMRKEDVRLLSWTGTLLARSYAPETFVAIEVVDSKDVSLRSISTGMDVGAIAKSLGGGGHRNAAGFKLGRLNG
jgi:uncharacterized protein